MAAEILTKEDLQAFKAELFTELHGLIHNASSPQPRKWIKSYEVREILGISTGTLQNMRINGTLPYTKVNGLIFYEYDDIIKLMETDKKSGNSQQRLP